MKKILVLAVCILTALSLFAGAISMILQGSASAPETDTEKQADVQQEEQETKVREAAAGYFRELKLGNVEASEAFLAPDAVSALNLADNKEKYMAGFDEEKNQEIVQLADDFFDFQTASTFKEYEIQEVQVTSGNAQVLVKISGADTASAGSVDEENMNAYMEQYIEENNDSLQQLFEEEGQEAVDEALRLVSAEYSFEQMKQQIKQAEPFSMLLALSLQQSENGWLIYSIEAQSASSTF